MMKIKPLFGSLYSCPSIMEKLRSIIGSLRIPVILFLCNAGFGSLVFAEGEKDYELFLRYSDSKVQEVEWKPTKPRLIYQGPPASQEERYHVVPCLVRMLDGTLVD